MVKITLNVRTKKLSVYWKLTNFHQINQRLLQVASGWVVTKTPVFTVCIRSQCIYSPFCPLFLFWLSFSPILFCKFLHNMTFFVAVSKGWHAGFLFALYKNWKIMGKKTFKKSVFFTFLHFAGYPQTLVNGPWNWFHPKSCLMISHILTLK